jgi:hypothetical protein
MTKASRKVAPAGDQLLHLVFGGELERVGGHRFADLNEIEIVGIYPDYKSAYTAWRAKAQASVDNARMRYYVVHLHRLLEPGVDRPDAHGADTG